MSFFDKYHIRCDERSGPCPVRPLWGLILPLTLMDTVHSGSFFVYTPSRILFSSFSYLLYVAYTKLYLSYMIWEIVTVMQYFRRSSYVPLSPPESLLERHRSFPFKLLGAWVCDWQASPTNSERARLLILTWVHGRTRLLKPASCSERGSPYERVLGYVLVVMLSVCK